MHEDEIVRSIGNGRPKLVERLLAFLAILVFLAAIGIYKVPVVPTIKKYGEIERRVLSSIRVPTTGVLRRAFVANGDSVRTGDVLLEVYSDDLQRGIIAARLSLTQATIDLEQSILDSILLAEDASRQVRAAELDTLLSSATLRERMVSYGFGDLTDEFTFNFVPGRHVELDKAFAGYLRSMEALKATAATSRLAHERSRRRSLLRYSSKLQAAAMDSLEALRSSALVRATIDGIVVNFDSARFVGSYVTNGTAVMTVASKKEWVAHFAVSQSEAHRIFAEDTVEIEVLGIRSLPNHRLLGVVEKVESLSATQAQSNEARTGSSFVVLVKVSSDTVREEQSLKFSGAAVVATFRLEPTTVFRMALDALSFENP